MSEVIILMGIGKCGKTTYAKKLQKEGYEYYSIDQNFRYNKGMGPWRKFLGNFIQTLNQNPDKDFVLDGWINACTDPNTGTRIYTGHGFGAVQEQLQWHEIRPIVVVVDKLTLLKRGSKETDERIDWLYSWWFTMQEDKEIILGSGDNAKVDSRDNAMGYVLGHPGSISPVEIGSRMILEKLKKRKKKGGNHGDPYYQTIELCPGYCIKGYNKNYEHKTWNTIKGHLDIVGKEVAEVGCHHGFYLLKAKEMGARRVRGFDMNPLTVESANQIAHFRELDVNYHTLNIEEGDLDEDFDTIFVMNTFHHLKNPKLGLQRVFSHSREYVVFESQLNPSILEEVASESNFHRIETLPSARPKRAISIYSR